ncbi:GtrA family protein [Cellulomonas fimi]|uniref:GtrA family protein n=1 Tax=Cellulomonas fimi TaxID=1708 RepID=UPI002359E4BD|nr:GtrA family protein [Cellulomonas fimi]
MADERRGLLASGWRFLLAGGANTAVTAVLLALLSTVLDPRLAYTLVFAAGVVLSTVLADRFVFGVRMDVRTALLYVGMYVAVYLVGLVVVGAIQSAGLPEYASALVVLVTAPLTFVGGRLLTGRLHRRRSVESAT